MNLQDFIQQCELNGIHLLFNQQSTGRVSGITYCYGTLIIKGQKLGNRFKWAELIKQVNYEQNRDSKAISEANGRTRRKDGDFGQSGEQRNIGQRSDGLYLGSSADSANKYRQSAADDATGNEAISNRERSLGADQDADILYPDTADTMYHDTFDLNIQIADDVDDEKVYGKRRRLGR